MNPSSLDSLEARARAAVRGTAEEIAPEDVPPLRSAAGRGTRLRGGQGGVGPVRRSAALRWGAPLAAAAAVVAVVGATGLVPGVLHSGVRPATVGTGAKPGVTGKSPTPYPADLESGLIGFFLPASGTQADGARRFRREVGVAEGKAFLRCMTRAGHPVPVDPGGPPISMDKGVTLANMSQFPDLAAIARTGSFDYPDPGLPRVSPPPLAGSKAYSKTASGCYFAAVNVFASMNAMARKTLVTPYLDNLVKLEVSAPVQATLPALRTCAAKYGWPHDPYGPNRQINSFENFTDWVASHLDGAMSRGASAATLARLDRQWAQVFVQCARPTVAVMERVQLAAQRKFLATHAREFAALVAATKADFARAARLARG